jgi:hypothetical protein
MESKFGDENEHPSWCLDKAAGPRDVHHAVEVVLGAFDYIESRKLSNLEVRATRNLKVFVVPEPRTESKPSLARSSDKGVNVHVVA